MRFDLEQGSQEWLDWRRMKITGTDAAVILGLNPWKDVKQLYMEKVDGVLPYVNQRMRDGNRLEPEARAEYQKMTGNGMMPAVVQHDENEWMGASLDGINFYGDLILEIKCGKKSFEQALIGEIPKYYMAQMQHCMFVANVKRTHYFCYNESSMDKGILLEVKRDDNFIEDMIKKENEFYQMIINRTPPDGFEDIIYKTIDHGSELSCWLTEYAALQAQKKEIEQQEINVKEKIIELCGGKPHVGLGFKVKQNKRKGSIKYSSIPSLKDVDLEQYRGKETSYWTIKAMSE